MGLWRIVTRRRFSDERANCLLNELYRCGDRSSTVAGMSTAAGTITVAGTSTVAGMSTAAGTRTVARIDESKPGLLDGSRLLSAGERLESTAILKVLRLRGTC